MHYFPCLSLSSSRLDRKEPFRIQSSPDGTGFSILHELERRLSASGDMCQCWIEVKIAERWHKIAV